MSFIHYSFPDSAPHGFAVLIDGNNVTARVRHLFLDATRAHHVAVLANPAEVVVASSVMLDMVRPDEGENRRVVLEIID